ncbi:MAG: c-type cytochrome [Verrucomicrobiota bacterium]
MMHSLCGQRPALLSLAAVTITLLAVALAPTVLAQGPSHGSPRNGSEIYRTSCASCHGVDGRGAPQTTVGFQLPLPDFTECTFATREPRGDWGAIVHDGGPARAFDRLMPAFGDALAWEEIERVVDRVKDFCGDLAWPQGELNLPRALATEKAYPEDEVVLTSSVAAEGSGAVANKVIWEKRFGARNQVEVIVPFSAHVGKAGGWSGGIGDIGVGAKRVLYHSYAQGTIFSVAGEVVLPTGNEDRGVGKGFAIFEPFAAFGQVLPRDGFFQFQGGMEIPVDSVKGAKEAFWRMAIGRSFTQNRFGRTWSPMVEFVGARELVDGEPALWDVLPQMQVTLSTRQHIMASVGVRLPLNDRGPRPMQIVMYLLWDWFDGPFLGGW